MNAWGGTAKDVEIHGVKLELTCGVCPEQYDAVLDDERVGYLRLRHGFFRAECTKCDAIVLRGEPRGDGEFTDDERAGWLTKAVEALIAHRCE